MAKSIMDDDTTNKGSKLRSNVPWYDKDKTTILNKPIQRYPMDPEVKAIWLEALRSEAFGQVPGQLVVPRDSCFCCLGVLGCVTYPGAFEKSTTKRHFEIYAIQSQDGQGNSEQLLSRSMLRAVGLTPGQQLQLAGFNDEGATFEEIANWVERNL